MTANTIDGHDVAQGMSFGDQHSTEIQPYGDVILLPIGLSEPVCREGVEQLNQLLADTVTLRDLHKKHPLAGAGCDVLSTFISSSTSTQASRAYWSMRSLSASRCWVA